ncbi:hypothetical protein EC988_000546 [Linderina pennispora]|nr:hypothetical protein EC988_000546 [Linderina pennispora]
MVELYTILVAVAAIASHSMVAVQAFPAFNTRKYRHLKGLLPALMCMDKPVRWWIARD